MGDTGETAEQRFAARMRQERERRGWRQEDLAAAVAAAGLPLHPTAFSKIESGLRAVRLNEAAVIAAVFGRPVGYMLTSTDPGDITRELDEVQARFLEAQADSDDAIHRAAALWNRKQELLAALEQERGGYSSPGT